MAFANGSITFKRFYVTGKGPERVDETLLDKLAARAIGTSSVQGADGTEIGWTTGEHILDTAFDFAKNAVADGLHFALRIDTNKPPADIVRSYQKMNEQAMLEASGREFLAKPQRREAREQAVARAEAEARDGAFRRMKQVPVFWDLTRQEVYLGGAGSTVVDAFVLLFGQTFELRVTPATSGEVAARWSAKAGETRGFDECEPAHFISPPEGADELATPFAPGEARSRDFLGTEWLTWLWYASHVESPEIGTPGGDAVAVVFEQSLQLDCAFKLSGQVAIRADAPTRLPEASVAVAGGKRPVRAGLQIAAGSEVFRFTLRGDAMNFAAVQVTPPEDAATARVVFEDRIAKLRDLIAAVDELYAAFLKRRLSGKWAQTLNAMRAWVAGSGHAGARTPDVPVGAAS